MSAADQARRVIEAWQQGGVEAVLPLVHPEFMGEVGPDTSTEPDTYVGKDGIRRYFRLWDEAIEDLRLDVLGVEEVGDDAALVELRMSGRGIGSGVPVSFTAWAATVFRDGLLLRMEGTGSREAAERVAQAAGG